jgi:hypothetical protein
MLSGAGGAGGTSSSSAKYSSDLSLSGTGALATSFCVAHDAANKLMATQSKNFENEQTWGKAANIRILSLKFGQNYIYSKVIISTSTAKVQNTSKDTQKKIVFDGIYRKQHLYSGDIQL